MSELATQVRPPISATRQCVCGGYTRFVVCQYCGTTDPSAVAAGLMSLTPLVQRTPEEAEAHARAVSPAPMAANPVGSHAASLQELRSFADPAYDTGAADPEPVTPVALAPVALAPAGVAPVALAPAGVAPVALAPAGVAPAFAASDASPFRVPAQVGSIAPLADWPAEPVYAEPVYAEPVYAEPVYAEPVYAEPVGSHPLAVPAGLVPPPSLPPFTPAQAASTPAASSAAPVMAPAPPAPPSDADWTAVDAADGRTARSRPRPRWLLPALAAALVAGGGGAYLLTSSSSTDTSSVPVVRPHRQVRALPSPAGAAVTPAPAVPAAPGAAGELATTLPAGWTAGPLGQVTVAQVAAVDPSHRTAAQLTAAGVASADQSLLHGPGAVTGVALVLHTTTPAQATALASAVRGPAGTATIVGGAASAKGSDAFVLAWTAPRAQATATRAVVAVWAARLAG